ncbi:disease resistance protein [Striga asiatica]|uniref:Disease resistance protein n=1 Tax=Striga asiatica TaxID=4170 RepID=A0A5A7R509_STRAF|nr:disease resistance protein [Striga asiatica]
MSAQADTMPREIPAEAKAKIDEILKIISQESDDSLQNALELLNEAQNEHDHPLDPVHFFLTFMEKQDVELTHWEVEETINQVKFRTENEAHDFNYEEFIEIIKLLKNPNVMDQLKRMYKYLENMNINVKNLILSRQNMNNAEKLILYGESGVGKTWMAKKIADRAIRQGEFDFAIWVYLDRIYDVTSLKQSIVYQLSIQGDDSDKKQGDDNDKKQGDDNDKIDSKLEKKKLLLILDNEGSKMKFNAKLDKVTGKKVKEGSSNNITEYFLSKLGEEEGINLHKIMAFNKLKSFNILVTTKNRPALNERGMMVMPWTREEAKSFIIKGELADELIEKSRRFPSEILIIAKTLSYFAKDETRLRMLKNEKEKLEKEKKNDGPLSFDDLVTMLVNRYEDVLPKSVMIDCFSTETLDGHFLTRGQAVGYNELITYWILEGHLGHFTRIKDAYEEGHRVLIELLELGLLENQESGHVVSSGSRSFKFDVREYYSFFQGVRLGLATTFECRLGKIAVGHGAIKTVIAERASKISTLVLEGNHIGKIEMREVLDSGRDAIENLAVLNPTGRYFPLPISEMSKLRLLVVRGCEFFDTVDQILEITPPYRVWEHLTAFELSGSINLENIPDHFFNDMPNIKNLNLSCLKIKSLPKSFYTQLTKLEILILKDCKSLEKLESLKNFEDLEVLDISGDESVTSIHDKMFVTNKKLRIINLSGTKIETLPIIYHLQKLESLSLTDCLSLTRIRRIAKLARLQILDISGAEKVEEFLDPCLEYLESLDYLDISKTAFRKLPSNIANPRYVYMRECRELTRLTPIEGLSRVEVLDLSGSTKLADIRVEFFKNAARLKELNLSRTGVKDFSFLSSLGTTLRKLCLSKCESLEKLESGSLSELRELERLNLSGCKNLTEISDGSFDKMCLLNYLDVSGLSMLEKLPSLSNNINLGELHVKDCPKITTLQGLDQILALKILDHSGTFLKPSPSFHPNCRVLGPVFPSMENIFPDKLLKDLGANAIPPELTRPLPEQQESSETYRNWSISNWRDEENGHNSSISGFHFLHLLKMYPKFLKDSFERFNFLIYPSEAPAEHYLPDKQDYSDETDVRNAYLSQVTNRKFRKILEFREFVKVPLCIDPLLQESDFIILIDSLFLTSLNDLCTDWTKNSIKACWIERCNKLEHAFVNNSDNNLDSFETLWISEAAKLKSIGFFRGLKSLYLEFCPKLTELSCKNLESLEILYIKYCENFESLFSKEKNEGSEEARMMRNLMALHLWGLPSLGRVELGWALSSLTTLRVGECPRLKRIGFKAPNLKTLRIAEMPLVKNFLDLGPVSPGVVEIKTCDGLKELFEIAGGSLVEIERMELVCLPELERIGFAVKEENVTIWGCPKLEMSQLGGN